MRIRLEAGHFFSYCIKQQVKSEEMIKNRIVFFLISLMVISPIASAIDHCADMHGDNTIEQSTVQSISSATMKQDASAGHLLADTDMSCHDSGDCALHLCGGCAVIQSETTLNTVVLTHFQMSKTHSLYHSPSYSAFKPPISVL